MHSPLRSALRSAVAVVALSSFPSLTSLAHAQPLVYQTYYQASGP